MEGGSPDQESVVSGTKKSSISSGGKVREEFLHRFIDSQILTENLEDWFENLAENSVDFDVPFELIDLQKFDYALEGVSFQQLIRMPNIDHASTSGTIEATAFLAIEDFLHASVKGLWDAFWNQNEPIPFSVACLYDANLKFYQAEKAIANGKLDGLCATALMLDNPRHPHGKWHDILELALLRPGIKNLTNKSDVNFPSPSVLSEALFYATRILLSRSLRRSRNPSGLNNSVFVILADCEYGGVVKLEGDLMKMDFDINNIYESVAEWIKNQARVFVTPFDRIWNKLGNANWGDIGALQILFATFHSMVQFAGTPKNSVEDLAAEHSSRLQTRRNERRLAEIGMNGNGLFKLQQQSVSTEIVEVQEEPVNIEHKKSLKLEVGSILLVADSNSQKSYQINEVLSDGETPYYVVSPVDDRGKALFLYVGSHPSHLEPAWEDMKLWYQVQRQTKIFSVMKQNGLSSKYLPELSVSGRIVHPGPCRRPNSGGNCNNPWCGTPILVTTPVGKPVSDMVNSGQFGSDEAIRCCHDCLSALSTAASAGIRHGDIRPENVICVTSAARPPYFVVVGWGHAILEERDRPAMNLHFSSTYALQEGKLCSASDAESLVYLLYFSTGGDLPDLDSVEGALEWRDTFWSKRSIQQRLGEISAVLKAFADYVDSLCGTPYPMDYEIWLRRLKKHLHENGKEMNTR